jgi:hypothetical protein
MGFKRSDSDSCLYFKVTDNGLVIWISWVDDCLLVGHQDEVKKYHAKMNEYFDCNNVGELREYVGCKIERKIEKRMLMISQPVIIQSFIDEFSIISKEKIEIPASSGELFSPVSSGDELNEKEQKRYRTGIGKLLYLLRWSRPDILNITRKLSRHFLKANEAHMKAMRRVMTFCVNTIDSGLCVKPKGEWNGFLNETFEINGVSDSDYAKDMITQQSVSGHVVFLNEVLVSARSKMQECVTLSVTEAELMAVASCIQDMIYIKNIINSMGLKVKLPMEIRVDNKGAKDLVNNWSVGSRTRHIGVRLNYLRELKEKGVIKIIWISSKENVADILTKNLPSVDYKRHTRALGMVNQFLVEGRSGGGCQGYDLRSEP